MALCSFPLRDHCYRSLPAASDQGAESLFPIKNDVTSSLFDGDHLLLTLADHQNAAGNTNAAIFVDIPDGVEKEMTIPELLVLKNDIAPKYERMFRAIPKRTTGVEIVERSDDSIKWRNITAHYKTSC